MLTSYILKSWKNVKQHVPLIKFRKGGPVKENTFSDSVATISAINPLPKDSSQEFTYQLPVIEDWELPPHYKRLLLDDKEIDAINSGGAY